MASPVPPPSGTLTIVINEATFQQQRSGTTTGTIFWLINGKAFPDEAWNDFVIIVLAAWAAAVARLLSGTSTKESLNLMDGPYLLLCQGSSDLVDCKVIERRKSEAVVAVWSGNTVDLAKQILVAGKASLRKCHQLSWSSPDIKELEYEIKRLRRLI